MAGRMERKAKIIRTNTEFQETASPAVVSWYSVVPALIATKEGGATPRKVPIKKNFQRHVYHRGCNINKPIRQKWCYSQKYNVVNEMFSMTLNLL